MDEKALLFAMIYGYLAYLHIRGRGGAIRSATQGQRQERVLMLPFPFLLPPLPNHHQNKYVELPSQTRRGSIKEP